MFRRSESLSKGGSHRILTKKILSHERQHGSRRFRSVHCELTALELIARGAVTVPRVRDVMKESGIKAAEEEEKLKEKLKVYPRNYLALAVENASSKEAQEGTSALEMEVLKALFNETRGIPISKMKTLPRSVDGSVYEIRPGIPVWHYDELLLKVVNMGRDVADVVEFLLVQGADPLYRHTVKYFDGEEEGEKVAQTVQNVLFTAASTDQPKICEKLIQRMPAAQYGSPWERTGRWHHERKANLDSETVTRETPLQVASDRVRKVFREADDIRQRFSDWLVSEDLE